MIIKKLHLDCSAKTIADLCREHGVSNATFCQWRSKFGGMDASIISETKTMDYNTIVETVVKNIKSELIWRASYETRAQATLALGLYIHGFYNPRRKHSAFGYKSPITFEAQHGTKWQNVPPRFPGKSTTKTEPAKCLTD